MKNAPVDVKMPKEKPKVTLNFPKDGDLKVPENWHDLSIDGEADVTISGVVKTLDSDRFDGGKAVTIEMKSVKIAPAKSEKPTSMTEAFKKAGEKRQP